MSEIHNGFSSFIILLRFAMMIPLLQFLIYEARFGKSNGITWRMRKVLLLFITSLVLLISQLIWTRFQLISGNDAFDKYDEIITLVTNLGVFGAIYYALFEINKMTNRH